MRVKRASAIRAMTMLLTGAAVLLGPARAQYVLADDLGLTQQLLGIDDAEFTPDGRYLVARDNTASTSARIYDAATGAFVTAVFPSVVGSFSGTAQDAVVTTNDVAVVSGSRLMFLDLTQPSIPLIADHDVGFEPRDLALTPDGSLVVVRGGQTVGAFVGGLFVFDVATGGLLAQYPGEPIDYPSFPSFDVDSVVATDEHAVCTSFVQGPFGPATRVVVWDLRPAGGGPPVVAFETDSSNDQLGPPHDVALTPDGQFAAVRSELAVALYRLDHQSSTQVWARRLWGSPGPMGNAALDSIEVTADRVATISRWSNGGFGAQLDVFDLAGTQYHDIMLGDPHDLATTPDGALLVVRTSVFVHLYDLVTLPAGSVIGPIDSQPQASTHASFGAGLDSVAVDAERAVTVARNGPASDVMIWDLTGAQLDLIDSHVLDAPVVDVDLTPDGTKAVVSGLSQFDVYDLRTGARLLTHQPSGGSVFPWCDGVAVRDDRASAFGYVAGNFAGWLSIVDLFDAPQSYCSSSPNSTGAAATIFATGSARVSANDLDLWSIDLPAGSPGGFAYSDQQAALPFGNGTLCLGGSLFRLPPVLVGGDGTAFFSLDYGQLPGAGAIQPGSTWNFQFLVRDTVGAGFDTSDGVAIDFVP